MPVGKRKANEVFSPTTPEKKVIMEPGNQEKTQGEDHLDTALKAKEARLNRSMKEMIDPLQTSINTILNTQKDWMEQKKVVADLKAEKDILAQKVQLIETKDSKVEDHIKVLENKLI